MRKAAENYLKTEFPARSVNEGLARGVLSAFLCQMDPTVEELSELKTAVSEAVTNAIVHGYRSGDGNVSLALFRTSNRRIRITVRDRGCGMEDVDAAMRPLFTTDKSGERGGMGFSIMETFTDKLWVKSRPGYGTTVTMVRKLKD